MVTQQSTQPPPQQPAQPQQQPGGQALPATGLQQQMASLQGFYQQVQGAQSQGGNIGFNVAQQQPQQALPGGGAPAGGGGQPAGGGQVGGQMNIQQMARNLASRYGLQLGRGELVDPQGNFLSTPEQLSAASGGQTTMGMAAAKMNYIAQAVAGEQNRQQQRLGRAAIGTGLGLVQSRGRGSAAAMQSGFYQDLADLYSNEEYEAADFSFFIEEERFQIQQELQRRAEKRAKKKARFGAIGGLLGGAGMMFVPGMQGAGAAMMGQGVSSLGETGWF